MLLIINFKPVKCPKKDLVFLMHLPNHSEGGLELEVQWNVNAANLSLVAGWGSGKRLLRWTILWGLGGWLGWQQQSPMGMDKILFSLCCDDWDEVGRAKMKCLISLKRRENTTKNPIYIRKTTTQDNKSRWG